MITFKAIVIPGNRRKDGTYPVNIRVTFKGKTRRLATTLVCTTAHLTRSLRIKDATILSKADELIARMRDAVRDISPFDLEDEDVDWVVRHIKDYLQKEQFRLDFFVWADSFVQTKNPSTRRSYTGALNAFERYLGKRSIDINEITRPMLISFQEYIDAEPVMTFVRWTGEYVKTGKQKIARAASTMHLSKLEHIFNAAKDRYNDEDAGRILIPRSPFSRIPKVKPLSNGQQSLGRELMQRIISAETDDASIRIALDVFVVSFGLMGANVADLYDARPFTGEWVYNRKKTEKRRADRAMMRVAVPDQLSAFVGRLEGKGEWWLNVLHDFSSTKNSTTERLNRNLKRWCEANGVKPFTMYAARHTWATLGRKDCGIDKSTIDDCLCHVGSFRVTDIYAEKAWGLMNEANRKVLELFTW